MLIEEVQVLTDEPEVVSPEELARRKENERVAALLLDVENLLGKDGAWIQGNLNNGMGGFCLLGGIEQVRIQKRYDVGIVYRAQAVLANTIRKNTRDSNAAIITFNDTVNRRKETVLRKLRQAAESLLG